MAARACRSPVVDTCTVEVAFQGISGVVVTLSNTHVALLSSQFCSMEKLGSIAVTL